MKSHVLAAMAVVGFAVLCFPAFGEMQEGIRLKADGEVMDIDIGHLVPCVTDWNGDGKKDLIVGQFSGGKIRLYLNQGTDSRPVFKNFEYLKAAGAEISLPAG